MGNVVRVGKKIQPLLALGTLGLLIMLLNPGALWKDLIHFPLAMIPAVVGLTTAFYLAKGMRYHQLLTSQGIRIKAWHSVVHSVSGEAFGLLPMGELARAELTSEHTDAPRGKTVATVAVQETLYALVIIAIAIPGSLVFSAGIAGIGVALMGTLGVLLVLTSNRAFRKVVWIMQRLPLAKRGVAWAKGLHEQTQHLLRDPKTWGWIILSIFGAVIELTLFWLLIRTLCGGDISWITTTFIYGAAYLAGAIANPVGGVGGFEATAIGLLHVLGVLAPAAVAVALLQRVADKGVITVVGVVVWFFLRAEIKRVQFRRKAAAGAADLLRPPDAALVLLGTANS